jgi:hypothetical protein
MRVDPKHPSNPNGSFTLADTVDVSGKGDEVASTIARREVTPATRFQVHLE